MLIGSHAVVIELLKVVYSSKFILFGSIVAAIEEAQMVGGPGDRAEFDPTDCIGQILTGLDIADSPFVPIASRLCDPISQIASIVARHIAAQRDGTVLAQEIWV